MSNLREAAQDALAALNGVLDTYGEPLDKLSIAGGTFEALVCRDAITALRAALAQPEPAAFEDIPACMFCGELIEPAAPSEDRPLFDPEYPDSGYCTNAEWAARKAAQQAPAGFKLVPIEPTPEMVTDGVNAQVIALGKAKDEALIVDARHAMTTAAYRAMLAAAPSAARACGGVCNKETATDKSNQAHAEARD